MVAAAAEQVCNMHLQHSRQGFKRTVSLLPPHTTTAICDMVIPLKDSPACPVRMCWGNAQAALEAQHAFEGRAVRPGLLWYELLFATLACPWKGSI